MHMYAFFEVGQNAGLNFTRTVTLQRSGCLYEAIIMHELLHTLGNAKSFQYSLYFDLALPTRFPT